MAKRFQQSGRSGFYLAVVREGEIAAGDALEWSGQNTPGMSVADVARLFTSQTAHPDELRRASELATLPGEWRDHFRNRWQSTEAERR